MKERFGGDSPLPDEVVKVIAGQVSGLEEADLEYISNLTAEITEYRQYLRLMADRDSSSEQSEQDGELEKEADKIRGEVTKLLFEKGRFADAEDLIRKVAEAYKEAARKNLMANPEYRNETRRQILREIHEQRWPAPKGFTQRLIHSDPRIFVEAILEYLESIRFFETA